MIPFVKIDTEIPSPLPECAMPTAEEISEEGFGFFRGTWFIGHVSTGDAQFTLREEAELIRVLDAATSSPEEFEELASAIEANDLDELSEPLRRLATEHGVEELLDEELVPLDGLEIGVAGVTHALSSIGCLTAASCRSHISAQSWSDCPVVFFAARPWRLELLADLIEPAGCGLRADRGMLSIVAPSILYMHELGRSIVNERRRFRRKPDHWRTSSVARRQIHTQLELPLDIQEPESERR
ncbi:MAG TPA: hypothetical protein VNJ53_04090 [Gaiellaceae bacterium]|nr:hypothetical protein [Gaiellaceae bacterium]